MFPSPSRRRPKSQAATSRLRHPSSSPTALPRPSSSFSLGRFPPSRSLTLSSSLSSPPESRAASRRPPKNNHISNRPHSAVNPIQAKPPPQCQSKMRFSTSTTFNTLDPSSVSPEILPDSSPPLAASPSSKCSLDSTNLPLKLGILHNSSIISVLAPDIPPVPLHSRPLSTFHSMASPSLSGQQDPFAHPSSLNSTPDPLVLSRLNSRDELISALQYLVGPSRLESLVNLPTLRQPPSDQLPPLVLSAPAGPASSPLPLKVTTPPNSKSFLRRFGWRSSPVAPKIDRSAFPPDHPASGESSFAPFRLIGVPLSHTAPASCITVIGGQKHLLPIMIFKTVEEIYSRGMRTSGLFRTPGNSTRIDALLNIFESPPSYGDLFNLHDETVFDICGLLKRFLCALPQPLLDPVLSDLFWNACVEEPQGTQVHLLSSRIAAAQIILRLLPKREFSLLVYVTAFLSQVPLSSENKATLGTIGRVFGPALLAPRNAGVLGLGPATPFVVRPQTPSARQLGPVEATRRAADGLIWLLNHWNQITDGLLDKQTQGLSRQPSVLAPSPRPPSLEQESSVANLFANEIVTEMGNQSAQQTPDENETIGIATSPRAPLRTPGTPLRQAVTKTYSRRQGSSLPMPTSLSRKVSLPILPEARPTGPIVEELGCSDPAKRIPRHSFDSNTSQASTTLTRATLSFSDMAQSRPNESIVEELSDLPQPLLLRSDSQDSQASITCAPVTCPKSTLPLPAELVIEELKCSNQTNMSSCRRVSSASLASTNSITVATSSSSSQSFPQPRISSTETTSSTLLTATLSQRSSLPVSPSTLVIHPDLSKVPCSSTSPPPLITSPNAVLASSMLTSEITSASASLPAFSSLSSSLSGSALLPRPSSTPRVTREREQSKSVMTLSMPIDSPTSAPRRRVVTLNPTRQRSTCGSIALSFPDAQSIVDQYEAHGPSSLRSHPMFDEDDRPMSPTSSSNFRMCGNSNHCSSLARVPRACVCFSPGSRFVTKRPNLTKSKTTSSIAMMEANRIEEENERGEQISAAHPMAALSVLLRNKDATIRAQSETIRAQADLLVESERRLAQWKSVHCRHLEKDESEENSLNNIFLPVSSALQAGPDDLRVVCEAALDKVREAWDAERTAVQADHAKLQFLLVETQKNCERACDQLAVVRRAIGSESAGA